MCTKLVDTVALVIKFKKNSYKTTYIGYISTPICGFKKDHLVFGCQTLSLLKREWYDQGGEASNVQLNILLGNGKVQS